MATMLNGAAVMDAAFLLVAANEPCPQPQTSEHLAAVEIMQLKHLMILQNKVDIIKESQARENYEQIAGFVQGTVAENAPVIPISAQLKYNVDVRKTIICQFSLFIFSLFASTFAKRFQFQLEISNRQPVLSLSDHSTLISQDLKSRTWKEESPEEL